MQNRPSSPPRTPSHRHDTHRRARRGLVAAYIHELSARHAATARDRVVQPAVTPALEPARGG